MRKTAILTIGVCALALASSSQVTAEPASASPIMTSPSSLWTGFYSGLNVGYGWANQTANYGNELRLPPRTPAFTGVTWSLESPLAQGFSGGAQIGYNHQVVGTGVVLGAEVDFQGSGISGQTSGLGTYNTRRTYYPFVQNSQALNWFGTVRGRVGYAVLPQLLVYGTGGFAYGGNTNSFSVLYSDLKEYAGSSTSGANTGWTAGGGVEWALWNNWSVKSEYLYLNLGSTQGLAAQQRCTCSVLPDYFMASNTGGSNRFHILRVGANYHFNVTDIPSIIR